MSLLQTLELGAWILGIVDRMLPTQKLYKGMIAQEDKGFSLHQFAHALEQLVPII